MRLDALLPLLAPRRVQGPTAIDVHGVAIDSRAVRPGDLFCAVTGSHDDGRRHVADAIARGAQAVLTEAAVDAAGVTVIEVAAVRPLVGPLAAQVHGDPSAAMTLVGVTGTNGKTTTTYLLEAIWKAAGHAVGVIGTIAYRHPGGSRPAPLTTPDAPTLQRLLAEMRAAGATHVAMEASSHALAQDRTAGCRFDAAVFTNLTRDHLDYHGTPEAYFAAKARLFHEVLPAGGKPDPVAVVHVDDAMGATLAAAVKTRCVRVGRGPTCDVRARDVESSLTGTRGELVFGGQAVPFSSPLLGAPMTENILCAAGAAWALGMAPDTIAQGIAVAAPPAGRVECIPGRGFTVVVDYAHTPDALARLLDALRPLTPGALITVFGCGGDRDRGKRPLMGAAAAERSDVLVITSDNPRTEDPQRILGEIEDGVRAHGLARCERLVAGRRGYLVEADRRGAIEQAIRLARPGDLVCVAGKGHEDYQIVGTEKRHFDDREEVRRVVEALA
jgi:UDP-N-acetylmuramoyl-L-alanyl-D-glutamate--2,6-diaminopimelate ligase